MRAIIVDDEPIMVKRFLRLSQDIEDLMVVGHFSDSMEAIRYVERHPVEAAFLDVAMPILNGIDLAKRLRTLRPDLLVIFISAYDEYIRDFNQIGGDYYIIKPYDQKTLEMVMERIRLLAHRQEKALYIQTFGRFNVFRDGRPLPLSGKAKEILALVVTRRGREISNEELFNIIWEGREYSNANMGVYYNALRRLKQTLECKGLGDLLLSTPRGQIINTALFDCDYYAWQDRNMADRDRFHGEFLSEYTWGEGMLADILRESGTPMN
ncbi:MAG: response regulator [Ruminococcaceae bacterium]|nr:response regulator [Oscillospiraceae bacterium]